MFSSTHPKSLPLYKRERKQRIDETRSIAATEDGHLCRKTAENPRDGFVELQRVAISRLLSRQTPTVQDLFETITMKP